MARLPASFYQSDDVVEVARSLIGKLLVTRIKGEITSGMITETEAYHQCEKACHAYNGRRTLRTEVLFKPGGISYVYLCYGIHCLINVTTGGHHEAAAVLIRAIEPQVGVSLMLQRRNMNTLSTRVSAGPGRLTKALGITLQHNGQSVINSDDLWLEPYRTYSSDQLSSSARIGVDYAHEDALLPWRFYLKQSKWVSNLGTANQIL